MQLSNLKLEDLTKFNMFFNKSEFRKNANIVIKKWALNYVAENAYINNFFGSNFNIMYYGGDKGGHSGVDIKILEKGTESSCHSELKFNVNVKLANVEEMNTKISEAFSYNSLVNIVPEIKNNWTNNTFINSLLEWTWNKLVETLNPNLIQDITNITFVKDDWIRYLSDVQLLEDNIPWTNTTYLNNFSIRPYFEGKNTIILDENRVEYNDLVNPSKELFGSFDFNEWLDESKDNFILVVNYNGYPLFMLVDELKNEISFDIKIEKNQNHVYQSKNLFSFSDKLIKTFNSLNENNKTWITNNLKNISQSFELYNEKDITINYQTQNNKEIFSSQIVNYDNYYLKYVSDINNSNLLSPSLSNNPDVVYNESNALGAYNLAIKNILNTFNNQMPNNSKKQIVDPTDILRLYDESGYQLGFFYGEYLNKSDNFNYGLLNSNINVYYDEQTIRDAIKQNQITNPAKVVVVYDLLGNVINPGVKLSKNEELLTTNDAIYDAESTVIDNILRTKIIRNDPTKIFYLEDDMQTYTLLDNMSDLIYSLTWNNKTYCFATYRHAWNYLYDAIKLEAIRVVK